MSGLILAALETPKVSRRHRLAAKARERREAPGVVANVQPRPRGIPQAVGCAVGMGPIGPMLLVQLADNNGIPMPMTPDQARQTGVALISTAAHFEILMKIQADQAADGQPVPVSPEAEALLAEAIADAGGPTDLKGDEGDVDDDPDLADPAEPVRYNAFDVNGQPCWEEPTAEEAG